MCSSEITRFLLNALAAASELIIPPPVIASPSLFVGGSEGSDGEDPILAAEAATATWRSGRQADDGWAPRSKIARAKREIIARNLVVMAGDRNDRGKASRVLSMSHPVVMDNGERRGIDRKLQLGLKLSLAHGGNQRNTEETDSKHRVSMSGSSLSIILRDEWIAKL
ncbi:unnamed protein product [Cuscuta campestris]|uniref:Uncharacterized protein n=1 Tax=Cuscuta campestris TaxID=132261 RepID=A0A484LM57_9ASTE|nr:unnamed protein product [Cuscuta campestris]